MLKAGGKVMEKKMPQEFIKSLENLLEEIMSRRGVFFSALADGTIHKDVMTTAYLSP